MLPFFLTIFVMTFSFLQAELPKEILRPTILVGSPIRQDPAILMEFLLSLHRIDQKEKDYELHYYFIDDNTDPNSQNILKQFAASKQDRCTIANPHQPMQLSEYDQENESHIWPVEVTWKVAAFKDSIIDHAKKEEYDFIFLIDSDLVLHPKTIDQLLSDKKDIVSNIFWTAWMPNSKEFPQVWLYDEYKQYEIAIRETLSPEEEILRSNAFCEKLRKPGVFEVGGLGACTLISRAALNKGVSFEKIKNITFWGEDRHFCVRAAALGIPLFVDTHYPAYHIYRKSALAGVEDYKRQTEKEVKPLDKQRITLAMIMRNEADQYLEPMLKSARTYITDAVIIDDQSDDNSAALCETLLAGIPLKLIKNTRSLFSNEHLLREQLWSETVKTNPDWILILDADEIFEESFKDKVQELTANNEIDAYYFRLYDFWDENHYRADSLWRAHDFYRPFLIRYRPEEIYTFKQSAQHCGRMPLEINQWKKYALSDLRLKHLGWARKENREKKYKRYLELDPQGIHGSMSQYFSILDENPNLIEWKE